MIRKLLWFVGLYLGGLLAILAVAGVLRVIFGALLSS